MCGEHPAWSKSQTARPGSSPHVRGTLLMLIRVPRLSGIIPACAGNTHGEGVPQASAPGSSPHVRGTPLAEVRRFLRGGIIPACAGNTVPVKDDKLVAGDHPRMCGEHCSGTQSEKLDWWIIPACAGNTKTMASTTLATGDHPRMCGEHQIMQIHMPVGAGSSPHVRGTLNVSDEELYRWRIIPACAGNTLRK